MEADSVSETCLKKLKPMDNAQNNIHVYCNTSSPQTWLHISARVRISSSINEIKGYAWKPSKLLEVSSIHYTRFLFWSWGCNDKWIKKKGNRFLVSKLSVEVIAGNGQVEHLSLEGRPKKLPDGWSGLAPPSGSFHKVNQFVQTRFKLLMHFRDNSERGWTQLWRGSMT
jgi:hypothetical protein